MTTVLVVEDDDAIRSNVARLLRLEGYEISAAVNGTLGLARAREMRPDIVISDISMPEMDGFALLEAIRADAALAATPVLLLTALDDRASMRRGMTAGADDYLAKPFTRVELLEAMQGLLRRKGRMDRSIEHAVQSHEVNLRRAFSESLGGRKQPESIGLEPPAGASVEREVRACVLFADVRSFTTMAGLLAAGDVAALLTAWFERACEPVVQQGGRHVQFAGDGLLALFEEDEASGATGAARRAVAAGLGIALAAHAFRPWLEQRFADRGLPPFAVGIGVHSGQVTLWREAHARDASAVGQAVNAAARLEAASKELEWTVVASQPVLQALGEGVQTAGMTSLPVRSDGGYLDVGHVTGLAGSTDADVSGDELAHGALVLAAALHANAEMTARAAKGALQSRLAALKEHAFLPGQEPLRLRGYRLSRKIAAGGMTEVYLAEREQDKLPVVLKVLDASGKNATEHLSRFIQEYALLSRIDHPNVVRIYDQGFTDDHAYIAMEYFPKGDLRSEIGSMAQRRVLEVTRQVARALASAHAAGVIHRDLKPENIMRRDDDSLALADFGIAKSMLQADASLLAQTRHGDVIGTPYYLSPEQAAGREITPQSDLYSLGVLLYEMLTGDRPFREETLERMLAAHVNAPTPRLPQEHGGLQPLLDGLMAKAPQDRFAGAQGVLAELQRHGFSRTLPSGGD